MSQHDPTTDRCLWEAKFEAYRDEMRERTFDLRVDLGMSHHALRQARKLIVAMRDERGPYPGYEHTLAAIDHVLGEET